MTAARKARACHAGALASVITAIYPATQHPAFGIPGLVSAAILLLVSASYEREAREDAARAARVCGAPHHLYPETLCTEPAGHYVRDRDSHAGPLIISGRERGGAAWDEPRAAA
ncbi:hypothetical protein [Streptomyces coelicoflavus]|uniref:hypothetical protein n=1 Tax=Streptomyces coelicoflavus TaxID=285562 RepID=UPI000D5A165F|nr:hypothetical protein [Streptomyces coelicoflavus]